MSKGRILKAATYDELLNSCQEFSNLVHAHGEAAKGEMNTEQVSHKKLKNSEDCIPKSHYEEQLVAPSIDQLIKQEEREIGTTCFRPYVQYLKKNKGFLYLTLTILSHLVYIVGQLGQNLWLATNLQNSSINEVELISVYTVIGCVMALTLLSRSYAVVLLGLKASKKIYSEFMTSIFRAPMSFYDSTPLGRILSRVRIVII